MRSFNEPFRGLPAEIRLTIWGYVALPVIELTPRNSKFALDFLIAVAQSNSTVYQELKAVIAQHGLSFDAKLSTKASIGALWRSITFRRPLVSKIKLLHVQASRPDEYDRQGILLWGIRQSNFEVINKSLDNDSITPIHRLEVAVSGDMWEDAADNEAYADYDIGLHSLRTYSDFDLVEGCYDLATMSVDIDLERARELFKELTVNHMVLDIVGLKQSQKGMLAMQERGWKAEMEVHAQEQSECRITLGSLRTEVREDFSAGSPSYCYQIRFGKGVNHVEGSGVGETAGLG